MKRCAFVFLKGKAVLCCLELCMAMAVLGQKDPSATAAALQRNALHDLTDQKSGLTAPLFHPLSVKSKAQPINLSRLADIQAYVHPTNKKDHGNRHMQFGSACDTEKTALYSCFPDPECETCYDRRVGEAFENVRWCDEYERFLCTVNNICSSSCGCEYNADPYFQCLLHAWSCEVDVDCLDTSCEAEIISLTECEDQLNRDPAIIGCISCVAELVVGLFQSEDTIVPCLDIQSTVCESAAFCDCGICTDEVEAYYACRYPECEGFACQTEVPPTSPAPTLGVVCYICGDKTMRVTEGLTTTVEGEEFKCTLVEELGLSQALNESLCSVAQSYIAPGCGCEPINSQVNSGDSGGGSGSSAMWALVAIPLIAVIAVIVCLLKRKKPDDHPVNVKTPINEFSETPPASPSRNRGDAHTPGSHPHQRDLSADEFYVNDRPNGSVAYSASHYSGGRSASESVRSHEDHHHDAFEEVGVRSGRINDPPRVSPVSPGSSNWNTASAAATSSIPNSSISSTSRNTGGYVVRTKDQCRTVCGELPTAMAIIVDDVVPMEPRCDQSKRLPDP